jgi:hypothetical protein
MLQPGGVSLSVGDVVGKANWRDRHATSLHWTGRCGTGRDGAVRDGAGRDDVHSDWADFKNKRADRTTGTTRILRYVRCFPSLSDYCYLLFAQIV